jgi:hypothetical protein
MCADSSDQAGMKEEIAASRKRESAWLDGDKNKTWRPKKRYRVSSCRWAVDTDNQLVQSTSFSGLAHVQIPEEPSERGPPELWPLLSLALDRGSDGVCSTMCNGRQICVNHEVLTIRNCRYTYLAKRKRKQIWFESVQ